jgi:hypothetical protein
VVITWQLQDLMMLVMGFALALCHLQLVERVDVASLSITLSELSKVLPAYDCQNIRTDLSKLFGYLPTIVTFQSKFE